MSVVLFDDIPFLFLFIYFHFTWRAEKQTQCAGSFPKFPQQTGWARPKPLAGVQSDSSTWLSVIQVPELSPATSPCAHEQEAVSEADEPGFEPDTPVGDAFCLGSIELLFTHLPLHVISLYDNFSRIIPISNEAVKF